MNSILIVIHIVLFFPCLIYALGRALGVDLQ